MILICPIAGVGSRLYPVTKSKHKAMIKLGGKLIIDHIMDKVQTTFANGTTICFIVGYLKETLSHYLKENYGDKFDLHFIEQNPLGTKGNFPFYTGLGDAIALAAPMAQGKDCFILLSDRYPLQEFSEIISYIDSRNFDGGITTSRVKNPEYYGVIESNDQQEIINVVEKPSTFISNIAVSGSYYLKKHISQQFFDTLLNQSKMDTTNKIEHNLAIVFQTLIASGVKLGYYLMDEQVLDFGTPEMLLKSNRIILEKVLKMPKGVLIGNLVNSKQSVIRPFTSIGDNSSFHNCDIKNSIIGDNCMLEDVKIDNMILADNTNNENFYSQVIQVEKK